MDIGTLIEEIKELQDEAIAAQAVVEDVAKLRAEMYEKANIAADQCGIWVTLNELKRLPVDIQATEQALIDAQTAAAEHKRLILASAQESLEMVIVDASLEAFAGAVDGKNKEVRDVQLAAYLNHNKIVRLAKQQVFNVETEQAQLEAQVSTAEMNLKGGVNKFKAVCHAAELQTQLLRIMAG